MLLALGVVTLGLPLPLRGASHADAILLVASATVSDFSLFLRGCCMDRTGFVCFEHGQP